MAEVEWRCCPRILVGLANPPANLAFINRFLRVGAQSQLPQPDVMVGYRHKVQGHAELILHTSGENDRLASAEAVRSSRIVAVSSDVGIQGIARVHVEISEVGVAQRLRRWAGHRLWALLTVDCGPEEHDAKKADEEADRRTAESN